MKHDYSWRCQCDAAEGTSLTLADARKDVKDHLTKNQGVGGHQFAFINQHERGGDMTNKDWKITQKTSKI